MFEGVGVRGWGGVWRVFVIGEVDFKESDGGEGMGCVCFFVL